MKVDVTQDSGVECLSQEGTRDTPPQISRGEWGGRPHPYRVSVRPNWIHFLLDCEIGDRERGSVLGAPGLWKKIELGGKPTLVWDIPRWVLSSGSDDGEHDGCDVCDLESMHSWAERCLVSGTNPGWKPPAITWAKEVVPAACLNVRVGGLLRRIALICSETRLALRCTVASNVDSALEHWRVDALELLARDASRLWGMTRFGLEESGEGLALVSEVDLTGGPRSAALLRAGAEAVSVAVAAVLETADLLADPKSDLQSIGGCWTQRDENKR